MSLRNVKPDPTRMARMLAAVRAAGVVDERVLDALARTAREVFVSRAMITEAYDDSCLPIGEQQTISMPSVVAKMTAALELQGHEKVLEIGTGCGYQTAVLSKLCKRIFTIERLKGLSDTAVKRLAELGITNFTPLVADGTQGWPHQAPFDAIIVTAAGPQVPPALLEQLKDGGRLVIPVGLQESLSGGGQQRLLRCIKNGNVITQQDLGLVSFVPLVGKQGAPDTPRVRPSVVT
jgi:protein-L-isoaspartate(D-aspartate) O-methyltransferase